MAEDQSCLDSLPAELQTLIMTHTSSPQSLYALIRASRRLYRVFSISKQTILSAIIHEILHPEALPDAWALAILSPREPIMETREDSLAFVKMYEKERKNFQITKLISLPMCTTICKLHRSMEYFCRDFVDRCSTICARHGFSLGAGSLSLSWTEEGRIMRALYRLELYGRLLRYASVEDDRVLDIDAKVNLAKSFCYVFPTYQVEEIACLHDYFQLRLIEVYHRLEDRFVESVLAEIPESDVSDDEESKEKNSVEDGKNNDGGMDHDNRYKPPDRWNPAEPNNDFFFSKYYKLHHCFDIGDQINNGLPSLRQFLGAGISEQIDLVKGLREPSTDGITSAFSPPPQSVVAFGTFEKDDLNEPNEAYLWMDNAESWMGFHRRNPGGLRQCGFVFWDNERLRLSGMMTL
ncbi:hypothetical protein MMC22_005516, partial [Lobaria immixta]|nr:hypothetical protein [Lobaria immixta]